MVSSPSCDSLLKCFVRLRSSIRHHIPEAHKCGDGADADNPYSQQAIGVVHGIAKQKQHAKQDRTAHQYGDHDPCLFVHGFTLLLQKLYWIFRLKRCENASFFIVMIVQSKENARVPVNERRNGLCRLLSGGYLISIPAFIGSCCKHGIGKTWGYSPYASDYHRVWLNCRWNIMIAVSLVGN